MKNLKMNYNNGINSYFNQNLKNLDNSFLNKSQELIYMSDYKILDKKINRDRFSNRIKKNYNSSIDHYKTQSNFVINDLKKYYQLNSENKKVSDYN